MDNCDFDVTALYVDGVNYFEKDWGYEFVFANNDKYCGKIIFVEYGKYSSKGNFHYHKKKDETFFVIDGILGIDFFDDEDGVFNSITLQKGQSVRIKPNIKHRFTAFNSDGCQFIEVSTHHEESDSYRCKWVEEEKRWVEYDPNQKEEIIS
jgi:mannose-6-phosphate isomerase-like protein (cupin superfamily)